MDSTIQGGTGLLVIDPQVDFMEGGALAVPGATADMQRLAALLDRAGDRIDAVTVTLDSHNVFDIAHPAYWRLPDGTQPAPFTVVTVDDVRSGRIRPVAGTTEAGLDRTDWVLFYLDALETTGKHVLTIWPEHCLVGTPGHAVQPDLMAALLRWSARRARPVDWVLKGLQPDSENYSAIAPEVPVAGAGRNEALAARLAATRTLLVAGEALSHCVRATVSDLLLDRPAAGLVMLEDATSSVAALPGLDFPALGRAFLDELVARGGRLARTTDRLP